VHGHLEHGVGELLLHAVEAGRRVADDRVLASLGRREQHRLELKKNDGKGNEQALVC